MYSVHRSERRTRTRGRARRQERVERPALARAVAVHDHDLARACRLRAAHGRVDLLRVELAPFLVQRLAPDVCCHFTMPATPSMSEMTWTRTRVAYAGRDREPFTRMSSGLKLKDTRSKVSDRPTRDRPVTASVFGFSATGFATRRIRFLRKEKGGVVRRPFSKLQARADCRQSPAGSRSRYRHGRRDALQRDPRSTFGRRAQRSIAIESLRLGAIGSARQRIPICEESEIAAKPPLSPSPASSSEEELLLHPSVVSDELSPHLRPRG